jgi:hypothetical protein
VSDAAAKLGAAQAATDAALEALAQAREFLERAAYINGDRILADPSGTSSDIRAAAEQLERVQAILVATEWPTAEDFEEA